MTTPTRDQVIEWAKEAGFEGYGEDMGEYRIPAPAFIGRLERVIESAMSAGRAQGLREAAARARSEGIAGISADDDEIVAEWLDAAAIEQLRAQPPAKRRPWASA